MYVIKKHKYKYNYCVYIYYSSFLKMVQNKKSRPVSETGRLDIQSLFCMSSTQASTAGYKPTASDSSAPLFLSLIARYLRKPVPAGMSLPTITFSFRPAR